MTIHSRTIPLLATSLGLLSCAPEGGFARAYQMASLAEGIGGPKAIARPGDFVLENDKVRVAILGPRDSMGPHTSGASRSLSCGEFRTHEGIGATVDGW